MAHMMFTNQMSLQTTPISFFCLFVCVCVLLLLHVRSSACDFDAGQGGGMAIESSYIRVASDDSTYV